MENGDNGKQTSRNSEETIAKETPTAQPSPIIQEADDFTHKWTTGEIIVDYEMAKTLRFTTQRDETNFLGRPKKHTESFCNVIGYQVAHYQLTRDTGTMRDRYDAAFELMALVQRARAFNAFKDATKQQRDYEQEIESLKERINNLLKLNNELALDNKRLHNLLPNAPKGKGDTEVGEVTE